MGEIDPPGQLLGAPPAMLERTGGDGVPRMLIGARDGHPLEAGLVCGGRGQDRPDRGPHRRPKRASWRRSPFTDACSPSDLLDRPPARPHCALRPQRRGRLVLLGERPDRAAGVRIHPASLVPPVRGHGKVPAGGHVRSPLVAK